MHQVHYHPNATGHESNAFHNQPSNVASAWEAAYDNYGQIYYYNYVTGE